jgi:hypothetical protein
MTLVETPALGLLCNNAQLFRASDSGSARGASSLWAERRPVCMGILNAAKGLSGSDGFGLRMRTKEGVHNVHTLGFGFGCTGVGLGRIGDVFGRGSVFQGERLVRVPSRARVFPVQRLFSL